MKIKRSIYKIIKFSIGMTNIVWFMSVNYKLINSTEQNGNELKSRLFNVYRKLHCKKNCDFFGMGNY